MNDRGPDARQFRASGLNVVIAAIVYWNSTYLADAIDHLQHLHHAGPAEWLAHTSPLTWEHIGFSLRRLYANLARARRWCM